MTLTQLLSMSRLLQSEACKLDAAGTDYEPVNTANLTIILNEGALETAKETLCLPADDTFNAVADQQIYDLSTYLTDFLAMRPEGLWWYDSGNSKWVELDRVTVAWLDEFRPAWRDEDSGSPIKYWLDGQTLGTYPTVDTSYTDGFHIYYAKITTDMSTGTDYPFGNTAEYTHLKHLSKLILQWWAYRAKQVVNKPDEAAKDLLLFYQMCAASKIKLNLELDLVNSKEFKMRTRSYLNHYGGKTGRMR